jgi:peptide/nickel transport system substrate-binding protein
MLLSIVTACAPDPVVETVVVDGEVQEVEKIVTVEVPVQVPMEAVDEAELERRGMAIFDIDAGTVADPELWNPFAAGRRVDHGLCQALSEPLVILNYETGEYVPWLAESFTANDDATVWTLVLREGIKWHDGEAFDADDVVFTVNMLHDNPDLRWSDFPTLDNVEKVDDLTVLFNLNEPDVRFVDRNIATKQGHGLIIVPEHLWADVDPFTFTFHDPAQGWPVFTGPYLLESASEAEFVYARDDNWWGAAAGFQDMPAPEKLIWTSYGTEETRTAAMAKNDLDSLMSINLGSFLALKQLNPNILAWTDDLPYTWVDPCSRNLEFNHSHEPWGDPEMRWAINYAVSRDQIVEIAYEGTSIPSASFLPAFPPLQHYVDVATDAGLYEKYPLMTHDPELAKSIIESKGWTLNETTGYYEKDGQEFKMTVASFDDTEFNDIAAMVVEQLQAIGINAEHDIQTIPELIDNLLNGGFEAYVFFGACGSATEPWQSMDAFHVKHLPAEGEPVEGFYTNAMRWNTDNTVAYSDIVDEIKDLPLNDPQVDDLFVEAMDLWMEELPIIPLTEAIKLVPFDETYWTGWPTKGDNYVQPATWWGSTHLIIHNLESTQ